MPFLDASTEDLFTGGQLVDLLNSTFEAGQLVASNENSGVSRLTEIATQIAQLDQWCGRVPLRRPMRNFNLAAKSAAERLIGVFDVAVEALNAETIPEAQHLGRSLQIEIDAAATAANQASELLGTMTHVIQHDDPVAAWLEIAVDGDIVGACNRGIALFESRTGNPCGPASAVPSLVYDAMTRSIGDQDRFWSLVAEHIQFLETKTPDLAAVLALPEVKERMGEVVHDLYSASSRAACLPEPMTKRQFVGDLLDIGHLVVEQALKFHLGLGCNLTTRRTFSETQACDVTELANIGADQVWPIAQHLGSPHIRNAFAHRSFRVAGDLVTLSPERNGASAIVLDCSELQDVVLESVETAAAMDLALTVMAERLGMHSGLSPQGRYLLRPLLTGFGWAEVEVDPSVQDEVCVKAQVNAPVPLLALAFGVHPLRGSVKTLRLQLQERTDRRVVDAVVPVEEFVAWDEESAPATKEAAFVRLASSIFVDGKPLLDDAQAAKVIAFKACQIVSDDSRPFTQIKTELGEWRALAVELGLDALQKDIGRAIRFRLAAASGLEARASDVEPLLETAGSEVPSVLTEILPALVDS